MTSPPRAAADSLTVHVSAEDRLVAQLAAVAIALTLAEAALPSPLPGVKPGLANIVTLLVLWRYGWRLAVWVSLIRIVAASLLLGNFLAPGFWLSLVGGVCSLLMLALLRPLPQRSFGPVSHSVLAALAHSGGQLLLARYWLIASPGVFYLLPIFATAALLFGVVNGVIVSRLLAAAPGADHVPTV